MDEEERRTFVRQGLYLHLFHLYSLSYACFLDFKSHTVFKELLFRAQSPISVVTFPKQN